MSDLVLKLALQTMADPEVYEVFSDAVQEWNGGREMQASLVWAAHLFASGSATEAVTVKFSRAVAAALLFRDWPTSWPLAEEPRLVYRGERGCSDCETMTHCETHHKTEGTYPSDIVGRAKTSDFRPTWRVVESTSPIRIIADPQSPSGQALLVSAGESIRIVGLDTEKESEVSAAPKPPISGE